MNVIVSVPFSSPHLGLPSGTRPADGLSGLTISFSGRARVVILEGDVSREGEAAAYQSRIFGQWTVDGPKNDGASATTYGHVFLPKMTKTTSGWHYDRVGILIKGAT